LKWLHVIRLTYREVDPIVNTKEIINITYLCKALIIFASCIYVLGVLQGFSGIIGVIPGMISPFVLSYFTDDNVSIYIKVAFCIENNKILMKILYLAYILLVCM